MEKMLWKYQFPMECERPEEIEKDTVIVEMNGDMAGYESGRMEYLLKNSNIPGRSNIAGAKFEPNSDGTVDKLNIYMKNALTKDMEMRTEAYVRGPLADEFNDQSDDVKIRLGEMERIGKVEAKDMEFMDDFAQGVSDISEEKEMTK